MAAFTPLKEEPYIGDWSSLIGIVTAIVGNILISFALNTQRYAHIRLDREQRDDEAEWTSPRPSTERAGPRQFGSVEQEEAVAEERRRVNARAAGPPQALDDEFDDDDDHTDERHALIPHVRSRRDRKQESLEQTDGNEDEQNEDSDDASIQTAKPKRKSYLRSPYWWLGIVLMVVGEAGNFLAYGFAPASIVSPLGVVALISNCLVAPCMLHEKFRGRDLIGVVIAIGGAVTVVVSAEGSNPKLGPDQIWDLVSRWEFLTYLGITVGLIVLFMILSNKYGDRTIIIDIGLVGLLGGYTALSTKGVASLLSFRLWFAVTFPIFYALVAILVATAVLQIKYVNRALQHFDSTRVIPTQFCAFTISVIVGSAILYRDFESATAQKLGTFVGGCLLTFLGVWFLTSARRDGGDDSDPKMPDEEQGIDLVDDDPTLSRSTTSTLDPSQGPVTPAPKQAPSMSTSTAQSFKSARSRQFESPSTPTPRLYATESSPLLPTSSHATTSAASSLTPDASLPRHSRQNSAVTPPFGPVQPGTSLGTSERRRRSLKHRASIANLDLTPGALTSPLSSGLSVVVADQRGRLRRGSSLRDSTARHARQPSVRGARPLSETFESTAAIAAGERGIVAERPRLGRGNTVEVAPSPSRTLGRESEETVRAARR